MKIVASTIQLTSQRTYEERHEKTETLRAWTGNVRPDFDGQENQSQPVAMKVAATGIYLKEDGSTGTVQEIDLVV